MPINLPQQLEIDTVPGPKEATPRPVHVVCFGTWTINTLGKRMDHGGSTRFSTRCSGVFFDAKLGI